MLGAAGDHPWGPIRDDAADLHGPQTAGIPGKIRVTYVLHAEPIVIRDLGPEAS